MNLLCNNYQEKSINDWNVKLSEQFDTENNLQP